MATSKIKFKNKSVLKIYKWLFIFFSFYDIVSKSKDDLIELGFPQFTLEDFYDTVSFIFYENNIVEELNKVHLFSDS